MKKTVTNVNWKRILNWILSILVIIISLILIFHKQIRSHFMAQTTNQYQVSQVDTSTLDENQNIEGNFDFDGVKAVSSEDVLASQWKSQNLPVIGGIAVPELNINLPIFKGVDNVNLFYGAGTMKPNQQMGIGNYSLASHHIFTAENAEQMLFSPLAHAKKGMKVYLTDKHHVYYYTITEVKQVTPEHVEEIDDREGVNEITLVTCVDYDETARIIVKGTLVSTTDYDNTPQSILDAFTKPYHQRY